MATLTITVPDAAVQTLRNAAGEAGYPATNAGFKEMEAAHLREVYREQKRLEAVRQVQSTVDAAVTQAIIDAGGIT